MKIAIVNDSMLAVESLRRAVESTLGLSVLWTAEDGEEAVEKCRREIPDIILMDIVMPRLDGVGATKRIMRETPCPILIVTASIESNVARVFEAMGAGAVDAVTTPQLSSEHGRQQLISKIRNIASLTASKIAPPLKEASFPAERSRRPAHSAVLIGSSAGGPEALARILSALPSGLPAGFVIVQHVDEQFSADLASWLNDRCEMPVRLAIENDLVSNGTILLACGGRHLIFQAGGLLRYTNEPKISYQPSVDVLFQSALKNGPANILGILLTGMGRDGASGLKLLRLAGHRTIAQDEATSAIYGMPRVAAEIKAASEILPLPRIPERINDWCKSHASA